MRCVTAMSAGLAEVRHCMPQHIHFGGICGGLERRKAFISLSLRQLRNRKLWILGYIDDSTSSSSPHNKMSISMGSTREHRAMPQYPWCADLHNADHLQHPLWAEVGKVQHCLNKHVAVRGDGSLHCRGGSLITGAGTKDTCYCLTSVWYLLQNIGMDAMF